MGRNKNIAVYGSGFAAILLSCNFIEKGFQVYLVNPRKKIGGILNPISIFEREIDIGPQFLENLNSEEKQLIERYIDKDQYKDIGLSYGSFHNSKYSSNFGIPDLTYLSKKEKNELLDTNIQVLDLDTRNLTLKNVLELKYGSLSDFFIKLSNKFLVHDASIISSVNYDYLEFGGRLRLFDDETSVRLKVDPKIDAILAASRAASTNNSFSIYPKKGPLGKIVSSMINYFSECGGEIIEEKQSLALDGSIIKTKSGTKTYDLLYLVSDHLSFLDDREPYCLNRPCIFHYFRLKSKPNAEHYYYMNYEVDMLHTRATNYSNYHESPCSKENNIICIEQPIAHDDLDKTQIERYRNKVLLEYEQVLEEKLDPLETKSIVAPRTLPLWKPDSIGLIENKLGAIEDLYGNIEILPIQAAQRSDAIRYCLNLDQ